MDWWQVVERSLEALSAQGPDPWASATPVAPSARPVLTAEQRAFLCQLADQPGTFDGVAQDRESSRSARHETLLPSAR